MAVVSRLSSSAIRATIRAPAFNTRVAAFQTARYYSAKSKVRNPSSNTSYFGNSCARGLISANTNPLRQTLKERFGELIPEKIEEIKALRK